MSVRLAACTVLALCGASPVGTASAFDVQPLVHTLIPSTRSVSSFRVGNDSDQPLAVEFTARELRVDGEGVPSSGALVDDLLFAFPPAAIVEPGRQQVVRLQWIGIEPLVEDRSFVVLVEQVPVSLEPVPETGVRILVAFNVIVHVLAPDSHPRVSVVAVREVEDRDGGARFDFELDLINRGDGHAFGQLMTLRAEQGDRRVVLEPADLLAHTADLFLPPGARRTVVVPLPGLSGGTALSVEIQHAGR